MSNNQPVRFPDEMKVKSPEIDSINKTAQRISNWLHHDLSKVIEPLQVLPSLPGELRDLKERLVEQFRLLFTGEITLQMKAREANIRVAEQKARLVEEHVDKKRAQLEKAEAHVMDRFKRSAEHISKDHASDLRRLDSHAYEITEAIYPEQVQAKFSYAAGPFWKALAQHAAETTVARTECLADGYDGAATEVEAFLDERQAFYDDLEAMTTDLVEEGDHGVPFWFAVVEDQATGEQRIEVHLGGELQESELPVDGNMLRALREEAKKAIATDDLTPLAENEKNYIKLQLSEQLEREHGVPAAETERFRDNCARVFLDVV